MSKDVIQQGIGTYAAQKGNATEISHKFVGEDELNQLLTPILKIQLDNLVSKYYHTKRAETVTSHTSQSEGNDL